MEHKEAGIVSYRCRNTIVINIPQRLSSKLKDGLRREAATVIEYVTCGDPFKLSLRNRVFTNTAKLKCTVVENELYYDEPLNQMFLAVHDWMEEEGDKECS